VSVFAFVFFCSNAANCRKKDLEGKYTLFTAGLDFRDAKETREKKKKKIAARNIGDEERGHFFPAVFFPVTHDGVSERGTTGSPLLVHQLLPLRLRLVFVSH